MGLSAEGNQAGFFLCSSMYKTVLVPAEKQLWDWLGQKDVCKIDFYGFEPNVIKAVSNVQYKKYITSAPLHYVIHYGLYRSVHFYLLFQWKKTTVFGAFF